MLKPQRRLFRRRESWEWIKANAYAGVALFALAVATVGWTTIIGQESRTSQEEAPRAIADERAPLADAQPVAEAGPPPSVDDVALSAPVAAPSPVHSAMPRTENVQIRKLAKAKPRQVAPTTRSARVPRAASGKRHTRVHHSARHRSHETGKRHRHHATSKRHRSPVVSAHARPKPRQDKSEAVYSGRSPGNMAPVP